MISKYQILFNKNLGDMEPQGFPNSYSLKDLYWNVVQGVMPTVTPQTFYVFSSHPKLRLSCRIFS